MVEFIKAKICLLDNRSDVDVPHALSFMMLVVLLF